MHYCKDVMGLNQILLSLNLLMDSSERADSKLNTTEKDEPFSIVLALNKLKET